MCIQWNHVDDLKFYLCFRIFEGLSFLYNGYSFFLILTVTWRVDFVMFDFLSSYGTYVMSLFYWFLEFIKRVVKNLLCVFLSIK